VEASVKLNAPVYLRLGGGQNESPVYTQDYTFEIGKAIELCPGDDITMIATGTMVKVCVKAAEELEKIGIHAGVVNMHTIKPLDVDFIKEKVKHCSEIVTVEEHSVMGGLGGAVAEVLAGLDAKARLHRFGIEDHYCTVGDYDYLLEQNGLTAAAIEERIKEILNRKDDGK
jgi:transketolase